MSKTLTRAMITILFLLLVMVSALLGTVYGRLNQAGAPNNTSVEQQVQSYVKTEINAEAGANNTHYDQAEVYLSGQALTNEQAFKAANPDPLTGLTLSGEVKTTTLWRAGDASMVEADYSVLYNTKVTPVGQMFMLKLIGEQWLIVADWRITISSNQPLIPVPTTAPTAHTTASPTAAAVVTAPPTVVPSATLKASGSPKPSPSK
jgi:hypothetical protein